LKRTKIKEELKKVKREGVLNIQPLTVRSLLHSSPSSKCVEGKAYNEKMQFAQIIIHDIYEIGTSTVEFLHKSKRSWCAREQTKLGVTIVDLVFIEESKEDEDVEQHFVEAQTLQTDAGEENIVEAKVQPSTKV
jgi:hypothetical protein